MVIIGGLGSILGSFLGAAFILILPIMLDQVPHALGIPVSVETVSLLVLVITGALICYLLIVEPHGFARLWSIGKEKLRLWPIPMRAGSANECRRAVWSGVHGIQEQQGSRKKPRRSAGSNGGMTMIRRTLAWQPSPLGVTRSPSRRLAQNEQFLPALVYRTGPYAPNGIPFADGVADYWTLLNERDGGINGVKIVFEECETGYATDKGVECYERLKGKGPTGRRLLLAALDRHHLRADREGAGRQDPAADHRLRPLREPRRRGVHVELHRARQLLDGGRHRHPAHRQGARRLRQAEGQEDQPRLSRQPLRQGADPGARGARQEGRLRVQGDPGHASGRRAEVAVAGDPPGPARLRAAVGLGRDELDRHQGSRRRRLSARQDDRRVVVGCGARRDAGRRSVDRLQGADAAAPGPASSRCTRTWRSSSSPRASRSPRTTSPRCSTIAA